MPNPKTTVGLRAISRCTGARSGRPAAVNLGDRNDDTSALPLKTSSQPGRSHLLRASEIPFGERPTCTVAEACCAVGLGKTKLYELISAGTVATTTVGRRRLVRVPSLLQFLDEGRGY